MIAHTAASTNIAPHYADNPSPRIGPAQRRRLRRFLRDDGDDEEASVASPPPSRFPFLCLLFVMGAIVALFLHILPK